MVSDAVYNVTVVTDDEPASKKKNYVWTEWTTSTLVSVFIALAKDPQYNIPSMKALKSKGYSFMFRDVISNTELSPEELLKYGMNRPFRPHELSGLTKNKMVSKIQGLKKAVKVWPCEFLGSVILIYPHTICNGNPRHHPCCL